MVLDISGTIEFPPARPPESPGLSPPGFSIWRAWRFMAKPRLARVAPSAALPEWIRPELRQLAEAIRMNAAFPPVKPFSVVRERPPSITDCREGQRHIPANRDANSELTPLNSLSAASRRAGGR
jgi:hypothetical protein